MAIVVEAVYEDGVFRLAAPLPLAEHQKVRIIVEERVDSLSEAYGMVGWKGDHAELLRFALDPELDPQEEP